MRRWLRRWWNRRRLRAAFGNVTTDAVGEFDRLTFACGGHIARSRARVRAGETFETTS